MKNAGKACNNRLYRHIRTFEKIVKNYFVILLKTHIQLRMTLKIILWMQMRIVLEATKYGIQNGIMGFCHVYI